MTNPYTTMRAADTGSKLMPVDYSVLPASPTSPAPKTVKSDRSAKSVKSVVRQTRGIPANRVGKLPEGLYPRVSRKKLALALGLHISTVSGILMGKTKVKVALAIRIAALVGVTVEKLSEDLERQGKAYWAARGRET